MPLKSVGFFVYTKIMYKCSDEFWDRVRAYKRDRNLATLNEAVTELLTMSLDFHEIQQNKSVYSKLTINNL